MKSKILLTAAMGLMLLPSVMPIFCGACAQGSLTPPGAPAPTMKTLGQIEPRIAITNTGSSQTITQSGSYYLTGDLNIGAGSAITISASNVKLDLGGHTIYSTDPNGGAYGVFLTSPLTNITVMNGFISSTVTNNGATIYGGAGFGSGIIAISSIYNVRVRNIHVSGCRQHGIYLSLNTGTLVKDCEVNNVGAAGIQADMVLDCMATSGGSIGSPGILANTLCNSHAYAYGGPGAQGNQIVDSCFGTSYNSYGIYGIIVNNSQGTGTLANGITATVVANSDGASTSTDGIYTQLGMNSYGTTQSTGSYAFYATYLATSCSGFGPAGVYGYISLVSCAGSTQAGGHLYNTP